MNSKSLSIALIGFITLALGLLMINVLTSQSVLWSLIVIEVLLWWPVGVLFSNKTYKKVLPWLGALMIIALPVTINLMFSPNYLWCLYVIAPVLWWPLSINLNKWASTVTFSVLSAVTLSLYYVGLNVFFETRFLFSPFIVYGLICWPVCLLIRKRYNAKLVSVVLTLINISIVFLLNMYVLKTDYVWAAYTIPLMIMWPITVFAGDKAKTLTFAVISYIMIVLYYAYINLFIVTGHPFIIYVAFAYIWWPLGISVSKHKNALRFSQESFIVITLFFILTNYVTTPNTWWSIYPISIIFIWPVTLWFIAIKKQTRQTSRS